jgi:membrane-bound ClpP family serine protease
MLKQLVSIIGATLILLAFAAQRLHYLSSDSLTYLLLNFLGGCALFYIALETHQTGLIVIEGAWALISLYGILSLKRESRG